MRDYYPLLSHIVAGLDSNTGESRRALYGRARTMLCEQLRKQEPPLSDAEITRERLSLEAAIRKFEADAIRRPRKEPPADAIVVPESEIPAGLASALPPADAEPKSAPMTRPTSPDPQSEPPRKQIAELALLAQVAGAREGRIRRPTGSPRNNSVGLAGQQGPAVQRAPLPQAQRPAIPQDLLTDLMGTGQGVRLEQNSDARPRPRKHSLPDAPRPKDSMTPLLCVLYFVLGFAQLIAFFAGLQTEFGFGGVASIGIFMLLYLTGSLGSIPLAVVAFYGAWHGWQWPIWGAGLLAFSFVTLSFALLGIGGFYSFFNRRKSPPIVRAIRALMQSRRWRERVRRWRAAWARFFWNYPRAPGIRVRRPNARR
jgi:hypothetical protein